MWEFLLDFHKDRGGVALWWYLNSLFLLNKRDLWLFWNIKAPVTLWLVFRTFFFAVLQWSLAVTDLADNLHSVYNDILKICLEMSKLRLVFFLIQTLERHMSTLSLPERGWCGREKKKKIRQAPEFSIISFKLNCHHQRGARLCCQCSHLCVPPQIRAQATIFKSLVFCFAFLQWQTDLLIPCN